MTVRWDMVPARDQPDPVGRLLHQMAQPLAAAALALDIAVLAESRGNGEEIRNRLASAVEAVDQAQAVLRAWSAKRLELVGQCTGSDGG